MKTDALHENFKKLCSVHQCKCTAQRFAVYACICGNREHPGVDGVLKCVRKRIPSITRESVFRILAEFSGWGIIYRMDKTVNARFDGIAWNHGHFICRECGSIQDFELPQNLPEPDNNPGFQTDHVELKISEICAECAEKTRFAAKYKEIKMDLKGAKTEANLRYAFAGESRTRNKYTCFAGKVKKEGFDQIAAGEHEEWTETYRKFSEVAAEEGFAVFAAQFAAVAGLEKHHEECCNKHAANVEKGEVRVKAGKKCRECRNCGHIYFGGKAPQVCPVCAYPQAYFEIDAQNC